MFECLFIKNNFRNVNGLIGYSVTYLRLPMSSFTNNTCFASMCGKVNSIICTCQI